MNNKGLQVSTVVDSIYFKTFCALVEKIKCYARTGQLMSIIFFFISFLMVMLKMFYLYVDTYYVFPIYPYYYNTTGLFVLLQILFSVFFLFWVIDTFWYNSIIRKISPKSLMKNMIYKLGVMESMCLIIYIINLVRLTGYYDILNREAGITISTTIIILSLITILALHEIVLINACKKLFMLTKEYNSQTC